MENKRFEFVLYKNEPTKIICARNFSVDKFNEDVVNSFEIKEMMDKLMGIENVAFTGIIPEAIKVKAIDNLWSYYNPLKNNPKENLFEDEDIFYLEVRQKMSHTVNGYEVDYNRILAKGSFSGNYFPRYLRNKVDIKDIIHDITSEIKKTLSSKKVTSVYAEAKS